MAYTLLDDSKPIPEGKRKRGTFVLLEDDTATPDQKALASVPMRVLKGMKDPVDGLAQMLQKALPDSVVNAVNSAADAVGGEGTLLGKLGIKGMTREQFDADIRNSEQQYQDARKAQGQDGIDIARFAGNVASPVNIGIGKLMPVARAGEPMRAMIAKGALTGAAGAASQPVLNDDFAATKAAQIGLGAAGGAVLTPVLSRAAESVAKLAGNLAGKAQQSVGSVKDSIKDALARDGMDIRDISDGVLAKLTDEVNQSLKTGKQIDPAALLRQIDFKAAGVNPTLGQLTRDPTQYSRELNLRGIQGAGEPLANRFADQSATISRKFSDAARGEDSFMAGRGMIDTLKAKDAEMAGQVRAAYQQFKESTGKDLEVPLSGLAQDYASILRDFGKAIPGAVRSQFEELGLMSGKQTKTLGIDDAERLIKTINRHYNPIDKAQARSLDDLRGAVQKAISEVSGEGEIASGLAANARKAASERFKSIAGSPAFKAAINSAEPDDFVKKYVIGGKVRELQELAKLTGSEGQQTMSQQTMRYLQNKAYGANAAGDGAGSQAAFNRELQSIGMEKLKTLVGAKKADELFTLGRVMANIQQRPAGSSVNESNTASAVANLLSKAGKVPYVNDFLVKPMEGFKNRREVTNALSGKLPGKPAEPNPEVMKLLSSIFTPSAVGVGAALGSSVK